MDISDLSMDERDAKILQLVEQGKTLRAIGKAVHLTGARVGQIVGDHHAERDALIVALRAQGKTFKAIGKEVHLTDARCCQIVTKFLKQMEPAHA